MIRRCAAGVAAAALLAGLGACGPGTRPAATRERAYRANNVGVALLEQLKYREAAGAFQEALGLDAALAIAHLNLGLALFYDQDLDGAEREAADADRLMPAAPQPPYLRGLIARAQNRNEVAKGFFERTRQLDERDIGVAVNVAQIALEERRYDEAIAALRPAIAADPDNVSAVYVLGLALTRTGEKEEGQRVLERAQALRQSGYAVTLGNGYLEQGRYAEAIASTGAEPELVNGGPSRVRFQASAIDRVSTVAMAPSPFGRRFSSSDLDDAGARNLAAGLGGGLTLLDADADGWLDLFVAAPVGARLLRNDGRGGWVDITAGSGLEDQPPGSVAVGAVSADYDNDGRDDLFVLRFGGSALYHNEGGGRFRNVSRTAGLAAYAYLPGAAAFVDVDHDGDLDLVIAGLADLAATRQGAGAGEWTFPREFAPAPVQLLRNNGDGTFTDVSGEAKLDRPGHAVAIVPTDFDNHRDVDLLVVNRDTPPVLYANQRDGTFRDVAAAAGLDAVADSAGDISAAAVGDINHDDWPDFVFSGSRDSVLALSDGHGRFSLGPAPAGARAAVAVQLADWDADGLLDLVVGTASGPRLFRNLGREWQDVPLQVFDRSQAADAIGPASARALAVADLDQNGTLDLVTGDAASRWLWRNSGDDRNKALRVALRGRVSNRRGVGARIQARAGSLTARLEVSAATPAVSPADLVFGVGERPGADVVRVLWPSGILQAETAAPAAGTAPPTLPSPFAVEELDRKPSSCPFLFTWNGERFEFVTDFLGGGEMGYWEGPHAFNHPDPVEYVRITDDQLRPKDGRLMIEVTNELEEVLYLDRLQLLAVSHPADVQIFPNEGMTDPPKPDRLIAVRGLGPPARAMDDHGHDVRDRLAQLDRRYMDDFALERFRGYAVPHTLTVDLGEPHPATVVLLTGWTDYAFSSDNVAAHQAGLSGMEPLLEVRAAGNTWRRLELPIGIPVGRPQTIVLDLAGRLRPGEHELRLTTNMRIYWDRLLVGTTAALPRLTTVALEPRRADLRVRGFSAEIRPGGQDPLDYDFSRVTLESPWKVPSGRYTREGDVLPLLTRSDDQFVIAKPGDALAIEFEAAALPPLPPGWRRTFLLRGDGFSKEMDINSASPDRVEPLPFHGMSGYPYELPEHYPETPEHQRYRELYNTRPAFRSVPSLISSTSAIPPQSSSVTPP